MDSVESPHKMNDDFDDEEDDDDFEMVPPHECLACSRKMAVNSVFDGVGCTSKGRDMRWARDAVWLLDEVEEAKKVSTPFGSRHGDKEGESVPLSNSSRNNKQKIKSSKKHQLFYTGSTTPLWSTSSSTINKVVSTIIEMITNTNPLELHLFYLKKQLPSSLHQELKLPSANPTQSVASNEKLGQLDSEPKNIKVYELAVFIEAVEMKIRAYAQAFLSLCNWDSNLYWCKSSLLSKQKREESLHFNLNPFAPIQSSSFISGFGYKTSSPLLDHSILSSPASIKFSDTGNTHDSTFLPSPSLTSPSPATTTPLTSRRRSQIHDVTSLVPTTSASFYEVLQFDQDASRKEIKSAFRSLAKLYHSDVAAVRRCRILTAVPNSDDNSGTDNDDFIETWNA
ncbi:hypothetical protein PIB30_046842 [Stylosanthes scabra]|uniref:J domain-containing protein n=1 Tax=Stylosanthes scabra TaxID=79078 RepID=A0ABU6WGI9_9FABA|nr:hypothetical protein [Stylosanthes scabra]